MGKGGRITSFQDFVDTLYADLFAYQTIKVVKTNDWRLTLMKRTFNMGVAVYFFFFLVLFHGYMAKETPAVSVSTAIDDSSLFMAQANLTRRKISPVYCNTYNTNYSWGPNRDYIENVCASFYTGPEFTRKTFMASWLYTYWQQTLYSRNCTPAVPPPSTTRLKDSFNLAMLPVCHPPVAVASSNIIPQAAEYVTLIIEGTYTTTWGQTRSSMATELSTASEVGGVVPIGVNSTYTFAAGEPVSVTYQQLLSLAGIDLDSPNTLNDGGEGPPWPTYRVTGIELVIQMYYQNFIETLNPPDPFNFADALTMRIYPASKGTFRSPGPITWYTGSNPLLPETDWMVRTPQGILITFIAAGTIGHPAMSAVLSTLLAAVVLMGAATGFIDVSASFLIEGFREQKFEDQLELNIRELLRTQLTDSPVREHIELYEIEQMQRQQEAEDMATSIAEKRERRRAAWLKDANNRFRKEPLPPVVAGDKGGIDNASATLQLRTEFSNKVDTKGAALALEAAKKRAKGPKGGFPKNREPKVARLIVFGEPVHGLFFQAQGFCVNCRCVRFQWFRSRDMVTWLPIPGATLPTFFANADDVGHAIQVHAIPVTDDGYEGRPTKAQTSPLRTMPHVLGRVHKIVEQACSPVPNLVGFVEMKQGFMVAGIRSVMKCFKETIFIRTLTGVELGVMQCSDVSVILDRLDCCRMRLEDSNHMVVECTFRTPETRDLWALVVRELSGDSIEMRNTDEYMAGYKPKDTYVVQEEEDDFMDEED